MTEQPAYPTPEDIRIVSDFTLAISPIPAQQRLGILGAQARAEDIFAGVMRFGGGGYYERHLLGSALILLWEVNPPVNDPAIIAATLLHDGVEDGNYFASHKEGLTNSQFREKAFSKLEEEYGSRVAEMVIAVTKPIIDGVEIRSHAELDQVYLATLRNASSDAVLVKMVDRLNNLRSLHSMPIDKQYKTASETLRDYLPIFERAREKYPEQVKYLISEMMKVLSRYIQND